MDSEISRDGFLNSIFIYMFKYNKDFDIWPFKLQIDLSLIHV